MFTIVALNVSELFWWLRTYSFYSIWYTYTCGAYLIRQSIIKLTSNTASVNSLFAVGEYVYSISGSFFNVNQCVNVQFYFVRRCHRYFLAEVQDAVAVKMQSWLKSKAAEAAQEQQRYEGTPPEPDFPHNRGRGSGAVEREVFLEVLPVSRTESIQRTTLPPRVCRSVEFVWKSIACLQQPVWINLYGNSFPVCWWSVRNLNSLHDLLSTNKPIREVRNWKSGGSTRAHSCLCGGEFPQDRGEPSNFSTLGFSPHEFS